MNAISAASAGNIIASPLKYIPDDPSLADLLAVNGVTDTALYNESVKNDDSLQWLDTLTPQQLNETTIDGLNNDGTVAITYGQLKIYSQITTALDNQASILFQNGTGGPFSSILAGDGNSSDIRLLLLSIFPQTSMMISLDQLLRQRHTWPPWVAAKPARLFPPNQC